MKADASGPKDEPKVPLGQTIQMSGKEVGYG